MLPPLPRCSGRAYSSLKNHPSVSAFPDSTIGSACTSSFSRFARRSLALRPAHSRSHLGDRYPRASDISSPPCLPRLLPAGANRRVGLAPTGKAPPCHGARGNRSFADTRRATWLLRADPGGPDLPEPTEAAQARDGPYLRLCRSRSTKNKTAIGSRGWINAALTRRYRARRVRSRCGTLRHVGFALVAAEARILLASSFVSMAMRRADGLPVPFVALGAAGADLWVGG